MKRVWTWMTAGVLLGLVGSPVAQAYAPSPAFILSLAAGKRARQKVSAMRVVVKHTDYVDGKPAGEPVEVTLTYRQGGRVRKEWTDGAGKHVRVSDGTKMLVVDGDKRSRVPAEPNMMDALWATGDEERESSGERATAVLRAWGVSEDVVSFSRMDGRIAWVMGAAPKVVNVPQVWVDKDEFLPLRFIRRQGEGEQAPLLDRRLREWGSAAGGEFYPGRSEEWRDGVLVGVDELVKVDVTPKIDEKDFKID